MDRYHIINEVGNGTFGSVWRALNLQTGEMVAIKKMKKEYYSWEECINLREVKSLRKMNHPNIVKLKEVIRENDNLFFVFEYMERNLYELMKERERNLYELTKERGKLFSETEVRNWCFQVFQGLAYMHQRGYFHRDLKPENLLVSKDIIKIADFGLAREINSEPPYTEYVSTRWYRAPEVLLQSPSYGSAVDMWAMGAIMAEMFTLRPLFPGMNEADEVYKICSVIGTPTKMEWEDGLKLANGMGYEFPKIVGVHLSVLIPSASEEAVNLIGSLCSWDPCKRPSALEVLQHPFFQSCFYIPPSLRSKANPLRAPNSVAGRCTPGIATSRVKPALEQKPKWSSGTLSHSKPTGNCCSVKSNVPLGTGAQKKSETNYQSPTKPVKSLKEPKYRPPAMKVPTASYTVNARGVSSASQKLPNMSFGSSARPATIKQQQPFPQPMKAGGWHRPPDMFPNSQNILPGRTYSRKVAG
ncbi:unnamed protein product [Cuscuta epithymum]|uniref:cyclin-dependent kinase n=1 Tax=Cuscuta epithymum TaxID=186058 RepID=A0AAV0CR71_9ASTE|nr:unnamed protein product [Cuscuta epithymum]